MDKAQIVIEIGRIQGELARAEMDLRQSERGADSANRTAWAATIIMLLGFVGLVILPWFISPLWYGAGAVAIAGLVGTFVEASRRDRLHRNVKAGEEMVVEHRSKLAELQAQLIAM